MKYSFLILVVICLGMACSPVRNASSARLPAWIRGNFSDDYGIRYTISDTLFTLQPSSNYHILQWNSAEQYLLVKNDENNPSEKGLYTRIDYMPLTGMAPYTWGFCLTVYNAPDTASAKKVPPADRSVPKKGCNGFPFSRMKKTD